MKILKRKHLINRLVKNVKEETKFSISHIKARGSFVYLEFWCGNVNMYDHIYEKFIKLKAHG